MRAGRDELEADGNNLTLSPIRSIMLLLLPLQTAARPRRLEAQDTALSRLRHGFESRRGQLRELNWRGLALVPPSLFVILPGD